MDRFVKGQRVKRKVFDVHNHIGFMEGWKYYGLPEPVNDLEKAIIGRGVLDLAPAAKTRSVLRCCRVWRRSTGRVGSNRPKNSI